jgi:Integral membrane protein S linking to the trans Golgi network
MASRQLEASSRSWSSLYNELAPDKKYGLGLETCLVVCAVVVDGLEVLDDLLQTRNVLRRRSQLPRRRLAHCYGLPIA